jgi:hypothetical protein
MRRLLAMLEPAARLAAQKLGFGAPDMQPMSGSVPVVQLSLHAERLPIYVTNAGSQLLCICYLFTEQEVKPKSRVALLETLLDLNLSVPLSDFGRIGDHYVLFGSISPSSSCEELALELSTLSDNAIDALATLRGFLKVQP